MDKKRLMFVLFFLATAILIAIPSSATSSSEDFIPPDLKQWKPWVLHDMDNQLCPSPYNDAKTHHCAWPSRLRLELDKNGGTFSQEWHIFADDWIPLPGDPESWPYRISIDGKPTPVVGKRNIPNIYLTKGSHLIEGNFEWTDMPETIHVPPASGLINLSINGIQVDFPVWDRQGSLWLQKREVVRDEEDRYEVRIYRLLKDMIPMQITNKIDVNVSGRAREIRLEGILLKDAIPMRINSPIPVKFGKDGELRMQAKPGRWQVRIETRLQGLVKRIGPVKGNFGQEIWSFKPQNHLRMVKLEGPPSVDPAQTNIPSDWKRFSTYIINPGSEIVFKEIRRGDPDPAPDQLHLKRTWWLDFSGRGFTVRDRITGTMSRQWFLAMNPPGLLGRVAVDGTDQLITEQGRETEKKAGVELRKGRLDLVADSRLESFGSVVPAAGWDHDMQSLSAVLNLPPGWRLITASGVDIIPGTWFERWTLLDLFLILIIAIAVWRLYSWYWGLLALLTLCLIYHEPGSPRLVWISLLAASALLRLLTKGWIRKCINLWRWGSVVALLVFAIPFMVQQVRWGIYPQLEFRGVPSGYHEKRQVMMTEEAAVPQATQRGYKDRLLRKERGKSSKYDAYKSMAAKPSVVRQQAIFTQDPNALIQTGPGLPNWKWRAINLKWNGPVDRKQQINLWLLSPAVNLVLAFLRVILLAVMIIGIIDIRQLKIIKNSSILLVAMTAIFLSTNISIAKIPSQTDYPPIEILQQLKERLLEPDKCFPQCADSPRMAVTVKSGDVTILYEVHSGADTAVPLPGDPKYWLPEIVLLDDRPAKGLLRDKKGVLWIFVPQGIHRVSLLGKTPGNRAFQIPMPLRPRHADIQLEGWEARGLLPDGRVEASIQLTPTKKEALGSGSDVTTTLPPFLHVERTLSLGLVWQVQTILRRVTPAGTPVVVSVPLIKGESVNTAGIRVVNENALINMEPGAMEVSWNSSLEHSSSIRLQAAKNVPWTETWILDVSPIWHCEHSGITVIHHQDKAGYWKPRWRPWPSESVIIKVSKPKAIPGQSVTIDSADLKWIPGERFNKGSLKIKVRASRGEQHKIGLPKGSNLQIVKIDGKSQPVRKQDETVVVPLRPGNQSIQVEWHQNKTSSFITKGPQVSVGQEAVNARVSFNISKKRWILWTAGPRFGPAVLFWSYVFVVILAAFALGRIPWTPLKTRHWILLGLGLTQIHPLTSIMIVGWLLALGLRRRQSFPDGWVYFNGSQIILVFWTIAALVGLYLSIQNGLLGIPDMQIAGNGSSNFRLHWTQDRISDLMPRPWVLSLPLFVFRTLMLLWALWLAYALLKWLRWGWECFSQGGFWRRIRKPKTEKQKAQTDPEEELELDLNKIDD